jgi:hypothetical protein
VWLLGPGSRCARPGHGHAEPRRAVRTVGRYSRFTMSNSSVLRSRGAFVRPSSSFLFAPAFVSPSPGEPAVRAQRQPRHQQSHSPNEGWMERRQAHSFFLSRVRGATNTSRGDRDPSRRSTVAIFGRGPTLCSPAVGHRSRSDCPHQAVKSWRSGSGPPGLRIRAAARDATPRSIFRIVSGDAPHERG